MDIETQRAISGLWKHGITPLSDSLKEFKTDVGKQLDELRAEMDKRFDKLDSNWRWRVTQLIALLGILVALVFDILRRS